LEGATSLGQRMAYHWAVWNKKQKKHVSKKLANYTLTYLPRRYVHSIILTLNIDTQNDPIERKDIPNIIKF
jgi:hypothetical protein